QLSIFIVCYLPVVTTSEIDTLSLHDAPPIYHRGRRPHPGHGARARQRAGHARRAAGPAGHLCPDVEPATPAKRPGGRGHAPEPPDRKSTRLNSSHVKISYAVFCLKKKKKHLI